MLALLAIIGCLSLFAGFVMMAGAPEAGGFKYVAVGVVLLLIWSCIPAMAHDHNRPDLDSWYPKLHSKSGSWCCDGPKKDAVHLTDVDWTTQNQESSHYRAKIPKTSDDMAQAMRGESFESVWVDVPDGAVIEDPNLDGTTLIWPTYGYEGAKVRCFMPGALM